MAISVVAGLNALPLVGRAAELAAIGAALDEAGAGRGTTLIVAGEGGVGKTRLAQAAVQQAERRGWSVAVGRAYPVESGVPYALFSGALLPLLRRLDQATLQVLTRGGSSELAYLFPALGGGGERAMPRGDPAEFKSRLLWNFAQFLSRVSAKQPLLVVLENLQWADASSLELLHFVARQMGGKDRVLLLCTYNEAERDHNPALRTTEQSLVSLGCARVQRLEPLSREGTDELIHQIFGAERSATREFSALLYGWTRGNPFFVEETLKALVESGRLYERDGTWLGWEIAELDLPRSIRDAVVARLDRLGPNARSAANFAAVIGTQASYDALLAITALAETDLLAAIDELRRQRVLAEGREGDLVVYDFTHPILQQTLYDELGLARARLLHATVAESLERFYEEHARGAGDGALAHADELAFHFARADARGLTTKAVKYLAAAGRSALAKSANREATNYLQAALERLDRAGGSAEGVDEAELVEDLARARQRLGDYDASMSLWSRARAEAERRDEPARLAGIERCIGLANYWSGRYDDALEHYDAGIAAAQRGGDDAAYARIQLAKGMCLQEVGRNEEAKREVLGALEIAERLGDTALLARMHRGLLLLYAWTGPADLAHEHGRRAIALAEQSGQRGVAWSAHWAMATLAGLTGDSAAIRQHLGDAERRADELRSPLLRLWTAEVSIEYLSGIGEWDQAVALGERTIAVARSLGQRTLIPRLLVWTGLVYLGRGDLERAKRYLDEAWQLSGAERRTPAGRPVDVHTVVPAHAGMAAYHLAMRDYRAAIRVGEHGLEIADRTGYVAWAIYRLLPVMGEAALWLADFERAERYGARLRRDSVALGHRLGLAWADACDALVIMLKKGDPARAIELLRKAADDLDAIPFVWDGARVRRQLAIVLAETGDRDGATRELRRVHEIFSRLGAERELDATREQLRTLGARPPARTSVSGVGGLTGREVEIIRLAAARKSNKEIGKALGISPRTVSTHLSNIFGKLGVGSRGELTDFVREHGLPVESRE